MRRVFIRGFLICLVPCLIAAYFAVFGTYRLGIDLAGGTILVYEVNLERTKERQATEKDTAQAPGRPARADGLSSDEMAQLAAAIKRRIDPADLRNIAVRPLGANRVEIILPTGGATAGGKTNLTESDIEEVKQLIGQVGVLEFRILANQADDPDAIRDATALLAGKSQEELDDRARKGLPPEAPDRDYDVSINGTDAKVRYAWVELSREERDSLGLSNSNETKPTSDLWQILAANRNKAYLRTGGNQGKQYSMLLFSRPVLSEQVLGQEGAERERLQKEGSSETPDEKKYEYFVLTRVSPLDRVKIGGDVTLTANAETDRSGLPAVGFRLNGTGSQQFGKMTSRNQPGTGSNNTIRSLAVVLDDRVVAAPTLNSVLTSGGQITGPEGKGLEQKYVNRLVQIFRSGALTAELRDKPVSENTMGPTLGADTIRRGTFAIGAAFAAVLAFMVVYYRFAGLVACVALLANLLLTIGFMVGVHAAFTLPGLAGLVLMLGMAVDANVLIYERLREERNKGANLITAIRNGYDRAFLTIIDTHLTSIFTAIVLYTFGNDQLKGFAISLTVGLLISLFTSLYMTRLLFDFWLSKKWLTELRMMRLFERPNFNPMKYRYYFFTLTTVLTVLGLGLFLFRGEKGLNVDFTRGTVYGGRLADGQERALVAVNGLSGLRDLLSVESQAKQLQVADVKWLNKPAGGDMASAKLLDEYIFEITYADGAAYRVSLPKAQDDNPDAAADGGAARWASEADAVADVKRRAAHLPDTSVEQVYLSGERFPDGKSRYFTVRTTETQPELVQVILDRLMRGPDGKPILATNAMAVGAIDGPRVTLTFDRPTSLSFVRTLLTREFKLNNATAETGGETFTLTPVATGTDTEQVEQKAQNRYKEMVLDVSKNQKFAALTAAGAAPAVGGVAFAGAEGTAGPAQQADTLAAILAATDREFEARPPYERLENFDSQLAAETRTKAFWAIVTSWLAILLYLWFRFGNWTFGLAAVMCLVHDLCFTLGAIAACHYLHEFALFRMFGVEDFKIDLAAVAALLTLVGYSVNEIIVNFARIREVRGKSTLLTPQMINDSVNQTLSRTILTSMTVLLVSGVLFIFGGDGIHLFAFVMVMGVLISTYSSIFVASPLLLFLGEGRGAEAPAPAPRREEAGV